MADIDTKVLYLETPSVSAPPAAYTIGVRMKNVGVVDRATYGYVNVHRVSTGLLEHTFQMAGAVMEPDEEKQAFADSTWDLREEDPGTEFILSGAITCDGDMVPANNILNPTTVTVTDEPPPPPPPVASHASQHEDGGSDELNLEGLHGVPADPIPYASHASKHESGGDDQVSVEGLPGALASPQIPSDHGNERHVEEFLFASELANHIADATPHDAATSLEKTAEKGAVDGYAGLDGTGKVPEAQLPGMPPTEHGADKHDATVEETSAKGIANGYAGLGPTAYVPPGQLADTAGGVANKFLRGDSVWDAPIPAAGSPLVGTGATPPNDGVSDLVARADHHHGGEGGLFFVNVAALGPPAETNIFNRVFAAGTLEAGGVWHLNCAGIYTTVPGPAVLFTFRIYCNLDPAPAVLRATFAFSAPGGETNAPFNWRSRVATYASTFADGIWHCGGIPGTVSAPWHVPMSAGINMAADNRFDVTVQIAAGGSIPNVETDIALTFRQLL